MEHTQQSTRKARTRAERDELVAAWRASGQKVPEFGDAHGIPTSTLYQWIRGRDGDDGRQRKRARPRARSGTAGAAFTEVKVIGEVGAARRGPSVTVTLRSGHSVALEGALVDPEWLGCVLEAVSRC